MLPLQDQSGIPMKKARIIKELKEWGIFGGIVLTLYLTGLLTDVAAFAQRIVLATGVANPKIELATDNSPEAAYNFSLTDQKGNTVEFSEFKNKVIFLNFWASWCAPCVAEMPNIAAIYESFESSNDVVFIMLNLDKERAKAESFLAKKDYTFPVYYLNQSGLPNVYESNSIPTTFVIDKNGKIALQKTGMANYDNDNFRNFLNDLAASKP